MSSSIFYEIIPNLFLSSVEGSTDFEQIKNKDISVIVNCTKDLDNKFELNLLKPIEEAPVEIQKYLIDNSYYIKYYRIPVDDNGEPKEVDNFYYYAKDLVDKIVLEYQQGKKILVHCLAGNQRSASFVCVFLMHLKKLCLNDAIQLVIKKKANVFFFGSRINFKDALDRF